MMGMIPIIDYGVSENCENIDSYGVICVKCGACGRVFNDYGMMVDDGGTTVDEGWE